MKTSQDLWYGLCEVHLRGQSRLSKIIKEHSLLLLSKKNNFLKNDMKYIMKYKMFFFLCYYLWCYFPWAMLNIRMSGQDIFINIIFMKSDDEIKGVFFKIFANFVHCLKYPNLLLNKCFIVSEILMGFICQAIIFQLTMNGICLVRTKCVGVMEQIECEHLMERFIISEGIASTHLLRMKIFGKSL